MYQFYEHFIYKHNNRNHKNITVVVNRVTCQENISSEKAGELLGRHGVSYNPSKKKLYTRQRVRKSYVYYKNTKPFKDPSFLYGYSENLALDILVEKEAACE